MPQYNIRTPTRMNHDLTLFKNFAIKGDQKIQFRVGFFNIFNQAFANTNIGNDINLTLDTVCNVASRHVPDGTGDTQNVCDPTKGFDYTQQTHRQLREDQPEARSPRHRVRAEVLLLTPTRHRVGTSDCDGGEPRPSPVLFSGLVFHRRPYVPGSRVCRYNLKVREPAVLAPCTTMPRLHLSPVRPRASCRPAGPGPEL